ncbi:MAG: hypothetical protein H0U13_09015 [Gemmatimonadaceae bacterium]|nr:hypothetical protein [Gemmatimonadaceae bacterium]
MNKLVRVDSLFGPPTGLIKFPNELEALKNGSKAMSVWGVPLSYSIGSEEPDKTYREQMGFAAQWGLLAVHHFHDRSDRLHEGRLFIASPNESWRIASYLALKRAFENRPWCDGAEALESALLGYSEDAISAWLNYVRHTRIGWGMSTIYILLSDAQLEHVSECGHRCVPTEAMSAGLRLIEVRNGYGLLKGIDELFEGQWIARVGVRTSAVKSLLSGGQGDLDIVTSSIGRDMASVFNQSLLTGIEMWRSGAWV